MLMQKTALITSGIVFGLLALSHAIRWLSPVEISINGQTLPFIISLSSGIILALLSIWMLLAARKTKFPKNENKEEN
jgi:hypothetical protein